MVQNLGFRLGVVSCSDEVQELLAQASLPQDELLRYHLFAPTPELQAEHQRALTEHDWICSSFELKQAAKTVWIITDPQQQSTGLYVEPA